MIGAQRHEHPPQRISLSYRSSCVFAVPRRSRFGDRLRTAKSQTPSAFVDQDPVEPSVEVIGITQLTPVGPGQDRRLRDRIFGFDRVAKQRRSKSVCSIEAVLSKTFEAFALWICRIRGATRAGDHGALCPYPVHAFKMRQPT